MWFEFVEVHCVCVCVCVWMTGRYGGICGSTHDSLTTQHNRTAVFALTLNNKIELIT
jgi:hypothetical protein